MSADIVNEHQPHPSRNIFALMGREVGRCNKRDGGRIIDERCPNLRSKRGEPALHTGSSQNQMSVSEGSSPVLANKQEDEEGASSVDSLTSVPHFTHFSPPFNPF